MYGSDLIVTDADEAFVFGVQSKALGKRHAVPLGPTSRGCAEWWVLRVHANSDHPVFYLMRNDEVRNLASQDLNGGAYWLNSLAYDREEFREVSDRLRP
jgi:hypothetical protein